MAHRVPSVKGGRSRWGSDYLARLVGLLKLTAGERQHVERRFLPAVRRTPSMGPPRPRPPIRRAAPQRTPRPQPDPIARQVIVSDRVRPATEIPRARRAPTVHQATPQPSPNPATAALQARAIPRSSLPTLLPLASCLSHRFPNEAIAAARLHAPRVSFVLSSPCPSVSSSAGFPNKPIAAAALCAVPVPFVPPSLCPVFVDCQTNPLSSGTLRLYNRLPSTRMLLRGDWFLWPSMPTRRE